MQRIVLKLNELDENNLTPAHVRTATVVRLPFHLCTGPILKIVDPENDRVQVWLRNKLSIPYHADIHEALAIQARSQISGASPDEFLTDALIVNALPELRQGELKAIKAGKTQGIGLASLRNPGFRLLNEIIAAHQMVRIGPYVSTLGAAWPRMLTQHETIQRIVVEVILLADPDSTIDSSTVLKLFDSIDHLPFRLGGGGSGDFRDYTSEQISALELAVHKVRNHAFYELKTNAIAAMLAGDSIVAIVLACAALEGAHGAFMRLALRDNIQGEASKFNKFMDSLLRDQGFYSLVQLSVKVLMKLEERPTDEDLERCLNGVNIRNAIMHASIGGNGKYKVRELSPEKINDGYSGIMAIYRAFEAAAEAREI